VGENPKGAGEEPELIALYRDLKELSDGDRETIRLLMSRLKQKKDE
jgi:hypothetical protein